jgi:hypothetical protein
MSDSVSLAQMGVPAVCIGTEALIDSVGRGMARALGYPAFPKVAIPKSLGQAGRYYSQEIKAKWAAYVAPEVARALTAK